MTAIGTARPRIDSETKVLGATRFGADIPEPGLLHARLVLGRLAHARIDAIDAALALALPGVVAVLTADDLPLRNAGEGRASEPLARGEIVFAGQPVAIVVAESEACAADGAEAVVVEESPLEPVLDVETAMAPESPRARLRAEPEGSTDLGSAHAAVGGGEQELPEENLSPNVVSRVRYADGDAAAALAASDAVVEARFRTGWIHQGYLETQTATARVEPDGRLVVATSTQGAFHTREQLAALFGLPVTRVRVVPTPLGGAFGGKLMLVEPLVAAAALALRRPIRLALTRTEDFVAANPAPGGLVELRAGVRRSGELTALSARVAFERGAFHEFGLERIVGVLLGGLYRWGAVDVRAYGVETNRVGFGAYRAPGAPPAAFALESALDELAERLDLDPLELRLQNLVHEGDRMLDGRTWPQVGAARVLESLREHDLWQRRGALPAGEGVGLAVGVWPGASGAASAACRFDDDGGLTIVTGSVDMSGTSTGFAAIAAETFGLAIEDVRVLADDTDRAPRAPISGGSQITYAVGRAVALAAEDARAQLLEVAAAELEADPADLEIVDGTVQPRGAPGRGVPLVELGRRIAQGRYAPVEGRGRTAPAELAPSVAGHLAHVRVDRDTGRVEVLRWAIAQDVGRALNPVLCEGQMRGGVAQGIGWALYEELAVDEDGQVLNASLADYALPSASDVPEIETLLVEVPAPHGPLGAKGIGEASVVAPAAAVANAIAAATGIRPRELPVTPPRLWSALVGWDRKGTANRTPLHGQTGIPGHPPDVTVPVRQVPEE